VAAALLLALLSAGLERTAPASPQEKGQDRPAAKAEQAPAPAPTEATVALRQQAEAQLGAIERHVTRLRAAGKTTEAADLADRVRHFRDRVKNKAAAGTEPELHLIGLYEGSYPPGVGHGGGFHPQGSAVVEVHVTDRPVVLALCSYEPVKWQVRLGKGVQVQRVVLAGMHDQEAAGLPSEIPIEKHVGPARARGGFYVHEKDASNYPWAAGRLRQLTRLPISTFQGTYAYRGQPFVLGPQNETWHLKRILTDLAPLYRTAVTGGALRFRAMSWTRLDRDRLTGQVGEFTLAGPVAGSLQSLPAEVVHLAIDPAGPTYYAIVDHRVVQIDPKRQRAIELPIGGGLPRLSWPCGLTFDTRRERLVLTSLGGVGYMYAYSPATKKWSLLTDMKDVDLTCFTYSPEEDCFYALCERPRGAIDPTLFRYGPDGQILGRLRLPVGMPPLDHQGKGFQMIPVGRQLAILPPPIPHRWDPDAPSEALCHVLDPKTGRVTYSGPLTPQTEKQGAVAGDLERLWEGLTGAESLVLDAVMWALADGLDGTVRFLRGKLGVVPRPNPKEVRGLITQLDDARFATREQAMARLKVLGKVVEPHLRAALAERPSLETAQRLRTLLEGIERARAEDSEWLREERALQVLARIGTPAASAYLRELASGPAGAVRTRLARQALQQLGPP
jgi:hypothetical protein